MGLYRAYGSLWGLGFIGFRWLKATRPWLITKSSLEGKNLKIRILILLKGVLKFGGLQ